MDNLYPQAIRLMKKQKYQEASALLENLIALQDEPNIPKYRFTLAHVFLAMNETGKAVVQLKLTEGEFRENARQILREIQKPA